MNKTEDDLIKGLKEVAAGMDLSDEQQEMFVEEAMKRVIKEFDLVFDDELEAYCAECGEKQKDSWLVYCPFCGKDGTDPNSAVWKYR